MQRERCGGGNFNSLSSPFDRIGGTMSSIFGGRDPFDDPFFTSPSHNVSRSSMLHPTTPADDLQQVAKSNGPFIQEIDSDGEGELGIEQEEQDKDVTGSREKSDKTRTNRNPLVEHPEDQTDGYNEKKGVAKGVTRKMKDMKLEGMQHKTQSMNYKRVTYGGINGAYYTATTTHRTGSNGMVLQEHRQADKTTGEATHRVSRGIHDKGHSLTRKLAADGRVDTMQTLHNLEEDELAGFEQTWNGNADRHMPSQESGFDFHSNAGRSNNLLTNWNIGFGDPFSRLRCKSNTQPETQSGKPKKVVRINIE